MPDRRHRSRSPHRPSHSHDHEHSHRHRRSRSPLEKHTQSNSIQHSRHSHRGQHDKIQAHDIPNPLPVNAVPLSKHELRSHRPLFALYLDVQKQIDIEDIPEDEIKGRWKSFVKKWNAGDLAEGWYDPTTFDKARRGVFGISEANYDNSHDDTPQHRTSVPRRNATSDDDEEEDGDFGPAPPPPSTMMSATSHPHGAGPGPLIPSTADLRLRNEQALSDSISAREAQSEAQRASRKTERLTQKSLLDELVPRAEPGSRERQLEKKREVAASNRSFAAAKDAGGDMELRDADVMGEEDSLGELRRMKEAESRKRSERELRREEILRARNAEREERVKGMREKEEKTMEMLKSIARARFGGGGE